jgi:hypothetical protein
MAQRRAGGGSRAPMAKVGRALSTALSSTFCSPEERNRVHQPDRYLIILAIKGAKCFRGSFSFDSGNPR